ncbi:hypothetical protein T492DRAFT_903726, partial [Pavlovales sp. CCMP2436]
RGTVKGTTTAIAALLAQLQGASSAANRVAIGQELRAQAAARRLFWHDVAAQGHRQEAQGQGQGPIRARLGGHQALPRGARQDHRGQGRLRAGARQAHGPPLAREGKARASARGLQRVRRAANAVNTSARAAHRSRLAAV